MAHTYKNLLLVLFICFSLNLQAESIWGKSYFPNYELTNQDGKTFRFFDDLVEGNIVVINFIYTTCPDVCPLETAQLTRVQRILGDRIGKDVHLYSITIDPDVDTPEVLKEYRNRFGARWDFFTGDENEIIDIRRKLGLYIENIGGSENNHNVNMIIGNQTTGRWMKRSPFENSYVLADQIGNWLTGWKTPQIVKDYAKAPDIELMSDGENLFRTRCMSCHTIDGSTGQSIGPDLLDVTKRRDPKWLIRWLKEPDVMIKEKEPLAWALYNQYNQISMPNMDLTQVDVMDLLKYLRTASEEHHEKKSQQAKQPVFSTDGDLTVMRAWVRQAMPGSKMHAAFMTLINLNDEDIQIQKITSPHYQSVEIHEMSMTNGNMSMNEIKNLTVNANSNVKLKPGGMHLMMMGPSMDYFEGAQIEFELFFTNGNSQHITLPVKDN